MAATTPVHPTRPDPALWRKAIGRRLRDAREAAGLRLVDVAHLARVSPQYLSEVERGRKEASSEVLSAVTAALGMTLVDLAGGVARDLARSGLRAVPVLQLSSVPPSSAQVPVPVGSTGVAASMHATAGYVVAALAA